MDDVLQQAKRLAALLAAHPRTAALRDATLGVTGDANAKRLEEEYSVAADELREHEEAGAPIEPELKRRLADLADRIRRSPPLQRLLRANAEFGEMMDSVQQEISAAVGQALAPDGGDGGDAPEGTAAAGGAAAPPGRRDEPEPPKKSILWTP